MLELLYLLILVLRNWSVVFFTKPPRDNLGPSTRWPKLKFAAEVLHCSLKSVYQRASMFHRTAFPITKLKITDDINKVPMKKVDVKRAMFEAPSHTKRPLNANVL